ncbi:MAG: cytochrome C [Candidatus Methylomirabilia bacterium]
MAPNCGIKVLFVAVALCLAARPLAAVDLKTLGSGDVMTFDPSGFREEMKPKFEIMKAKCVKCHTMERTIVAIKTGVAPVSGQPFDRSATKAYGIKMLRKPDSDMNKEQVKAVVELMNYLLDEADR